MRPHKRVSLGYSYTFSSMSYTALKQKKETQRIPIEKIVLGVIAVTAIPAVLAILPGVAIAVKEYEKLMRMKRYYPKKYINDIISKLQRKGYISFKTQHGKKFLYLTEKGKKRLEQYKCGERSIKKPKKWDGKWRIIIFDIPEDRRVLRNQIRGNLINLGFVRLQHSVWIYPYPCEDVITMLKADFHIGKRVLYITAQKVEYDRDFKGKFKL